MPKMPPMISGSSHPEPLYGPDCGATGVALGVIVAVGVAVGVGVMVWVGVLVAVRVAVGVGVTVAVGSGVLVGVAEGRGVTGNRTVADGVGGSGVGVGVLVGIGVTRSKGPSRVGGEVGIGVLVKVGVAVGGSGVKVAVGVPVGSTGVWVAVGVAVGGSGVKVAVGVAVGGTGVFLAVGRVVGVGRGVGSACWIRWFSLPCGIKPCPSPKITSVECIPQGLPWNVAVQGGTIPIGQRTSISPSTHSILLLKTVRITPPQSSRRRRVTPVPPLSRPGQDGAPQVQAR